MPAAWIFASLSSARFTRAASSLFGSGLGSSALTTGGGGGGGGAGFATGGGSGALAAGLGGASVPHAAGATTRRAAGGFLQCFPEGKGRDPPPRRGLRRAAGL